MLNLDLDFEKAVRMLVEHMPLSDETSRKPALFHALRVGVSLYEQNYPRDIVLAGVLHDALEWSGITEEMLKEEFGDRITALVRACTKNDSIKDPKQKIDELIGRCAHVGRDALIIKAADILDSFAYYTRANNTNELLYCARNAEAIFRFKPEEMGDPIFDELKKWHERCAVSL